MEAVHEGIDTLASLEQRITRAVELITSLRNENQQLKQDLEVTRNEWEATKAERDESIAMGAEFQKDNDELQQRVKQLSGELSELKDERKQVKVRIEKLLSQMDLFSAS
jgi:chromosome segregation ATPase